MAILIFSFHLLNTDFSRKAEEQKHKIELRSTFSFTRENLRPGYTKSCKQARAKSVLNRGSTVFLGLNSLQTGSPYGLFRE